MVATNQTAFEKLILSNNVKHNISLSLNLKKYANLYKYNKICKIMR